jgi:hypothetical protein
LFRPAFIVIVGAFATRLTGLTLFDLVLGEVVFILGQIIFRLVIDDRFELGGVAGRGPELETDILAPSSSPSGTTATVTP